MNNKEFGILKSMSLLYVEDDAETREELAMMLEPWLGELHIVADGQSGLDLFMKKKPDIVVTDIQMPRLSGLAMSAEIRTINPEQSIVIVSAYNDVEYLFRAIELGIDHYITKPLNVGRLLEKLAHLANIHLALKKHRHDQILLEQYKNLVDQSAIVCKTDLSGRISYVNDKLCSISGFTRQEMLGQDIAFLHCNRERGEGWNEAACGRKWSGISHNRTREGAVYVVERSLVPVIIESGEIAEIIALDVNITSFFENYEDLRLSLELSNLSLQEQRHFLAEYKRALELGTCVCFIDSNLHILSINRPFEQLLGYTSAEISGKSVEQIIPRLSERDKLGNTATLDELNSRIICFNARNGEELQFRVSCVALHEPTGEIKSVIMICHDITESIRLSLDIAESQREFLYMMGDVVERRSDETGQHVRRVAMISKLLALKAGLGQETADMIEAAAPMHDIGKVGIRDAVLNKPGQLDASEYKEMMHHAEIGHTILTRVERPLIRLASVIAQQHHEHWNGKGYPKGLKGEEIHIAGRIVAIADVLDALFTERVYKPAWDDKRVYEYFLAERGEQFDPDLIDLLLMHWDNIEEIRNASV